VLGLVVGSEYLGAQSAEVQLFSDGEQFNGGAANSVSLTHDEVDASRDVHPVTAYFLGHKM
jgi:hypothetical protein